MVEVFRTNVKDPDQACAVLSRIHATFPDYSANFDLQDCDKILRVVSCQKNIENAGLIQIIRDFGLEAEVLPDDVKEIRAV